MIVGSEKYVLHQIPAGILHPGKTNVIGNGVAVDPVVLFEEIDGLVERGVSVTPENLLVSGGAHVIFDYHKRIDAGAERWRGAGPYRDDRTWNRSLLLGQGRAHRDPDRRPARAPGAAGVD